MTTAMCRCQVLQTQLSSDVFIVTTERGRGEAIAKKWACLNEDEWGAFGIESDILLTIRLFHLVRLQLLPTTWQHWEMDIDYKRLLLSTLSFCLSSRHLFLSLVLALFPLSPSPFLIFSALRFFLSLPLSPYLLQLIFPLLLFPSLIPAPSLLSLPHFSLHISPFPISLSPFCHAIP